MLSQGQQVATHHFQIGKLNGCEVVTLVLGETEQKHRAPSGAVRDDCAVPAALAASRPSDAELDEPAAKLASDNRITWGSELKRWDAGRKLFACKATADIFGYVGEVLFPSLVLGQITAVADDHLVFRAEDGAETRHVAVVRTVKTSFDKRGSGPEATLNWASCRR